MVVLVVLGVVLEQVEAVAKPLLLPVLKKTTPRTTKTTTRTTKTTRPSQNTFKTGIWRFIMVPELFRKLRETPGNNFHLVSSKSEPGCPSYDQKTKKT